MRSIKLARAAAAAILLGYWLTVPATTLGTVSGGCTATGDLDVGRRGHHHGHRVASQVHRRCRRLGDRAIEDDQRPGWCGQRSDSASRSRAAAGDGDTAGSVDGISVEPYAILGHRFTVAGSASGEGAPCSGQIVIILDDVDIAVHRPRRWRHPRRADRPHRDPGRSPLAGRRRDGVHRSPVRFPRRCRSRPCAGAVRDPGSHWIRGTRDRDRRRRPGPDPERPIAVVGDRNLSRPGPWGAGCPACGSRCTLCPLTTGTAREDQDAAHRPRRARPGQLDRRQGIDDPEARGAPTRRPSRVPSSSSSRSCSTGRTSARSRTPSTTATPS